MLHAPSIRATRVVAAVAVAATATACSPIYVIRAGIAEARILSARRPIPEVVLDERTDPSTRGKLTLAMEARRFAALDLGLDVGDAFTSYTRLDRDTLVMVLSAAERTELRAKTWWFPIVGHVPYRGYFDFEGAERERAALERDGYDTYLRPSSAFSTLGWFADPLLSTTVRLDVVALVGTIVHELSHNHLFVSSQVRFNESFAQFVGGAGAVRFFCERAGGGQDTVLCHRAQARWRDQIRFSAFLDPLVRDLETLYAEGRAGTRSTEQVLEHRADLFDAARARFLDELRPSLEASTFGSFETEPLNNATLLARMRYYHRLGDFQSLLDQHAGDLRATVAFLTRGAGSVPDPFSLLPTSRLPTG